MSKRQKLEAVVSLHSKRELMFFIELTVSFYPREGCQPQWACFSTSINPITVASNRHESLSTDDSRTHQVDILD